ncbi:MAG: flagellar motor protein MotB [Chitinivibrionia bacterium]|nr:flagellar motor protein MotB [Chitinivibrionia bacterium]
MPEENIEEQKCPPCKQKIAEWMTSYSDLMALLVCFFVLLFALSTVDPGKFDLAASSFQQAFNGVMTSLPTVPIHQEVIRPRLGGDAQNKRIAADAAMRIREVAQRENLQDAVKVEVTDSGIAIRISDRVSFDPGSDRLHADFSTILQEITRIANDMPDREVRVEGHTDNVPIRTARFPSNWELSAARAVAVLRYLYQNGVAPSRLSAVGYGEFRPVASNATEAGRRENRRIEVYIEYLDKR